MRLFRAVIVSILAVLSHTLGNPRSNFSYRRIAPILSLNSGDRRSFLPQLGFASINALVSHPRPAGAMWQQWTPEDMLFYVDKAQKGNVTSVLASMDEAAETSWMMNMGPKKGHIVSEIIYELKPKRVLEIGTFLGYMSIYMSEALPDGSLLVTIEKDEVNHAAAVSIMTKAFGNLSSARVPIDSWLGASSAVLESRAFRSKYGGEAPFDLVLMDHWKPEYARDLKLLERLGLVAQGSVVLADNVIFPGAPELLAYLGVPHAATEDEVSGQECLRTTPEALRGAEYNANGWRTKLLPVPFEYRPLTPDAISYSVRF